MAEYGAGSIRALEGLEAVRTRPGMYIGSTGERGLHHLIWEVVDNSVDEALAGFCDTINVTLLPDGGVRVADNGRGIPVAMHEKGMPAVEVVMTVLHAGGKFGDGGYSVSGGLHGVGISVVNALSRRVEVEIARDGYFWDIGFCDGGKLNHKLGQGQPTDTTGTTVTFWADPTIFTETTIYDWDIIAKRFQETAFLNKGLTLTLTDERGSKPRSATWCYANGLVDFVAYLNSSRQAIHPSIISIESEQPGLSAEIAMQWTAAFSESVHSFANTINTHEGGTHEEGFRSALTGVVNRYAAEKKLVKDKDEKLTGEDIREGLTAIISIKISEPQFEGQTKTKLGNSEVRSFVQKACNDALADWFDAHPNEAKDIIQRAASAAAARVASRKARDLVRRKTSMGGASMPGKLSDCTSRDPAISELYIVEGDSAGGSAKGGRDPHRQAILPIRGKILNVEKARLDKILKNNEVEGIITALGCGIHDDFDLTKLRYHKLVLMADADVDGAHIQTLLLTLLFRFMRPLIEGGHVYLAQPPLYKLKWSAGEPDYAYSDAERDQIRAAGEANGRRLSKDGIQRFKGLGEMNAEELWDTTMDPDKRLLLRITVDDAQAADELFTILMGEAVDPRKAFITANADSADIDA